MLLASLMASASVIVYTKWFGNNFLVFITNRFPCSIYLLPAHFYMCNISTALFFFFLSFFIIIVFSLALSLFRVAIVFFLFSVLCVFHNLMLQIITAHCWSLTEKANDPLFQWPLFASTFNLYDFKWLLSFLHSSHRDQCALLYTKTVIRRIFVRDCVCESVSGTMYQTHNAIYTSSSLRYRLCMLRLRRTGKLLRLMWDSPTKWIFYSTSIFFCEAMEK